MINFSALHAINLILKCIKWIRFSAVKMLPPCMKTTLLIVNNAWLCIVFILSIYIAHGFLYIFIYAI